MTKGEFLKKSLDAMFIREEDMDRASKILDGVNGMSVRDARGFLLRCSKALELAEIHLDRKEAVAELLENDPAGSGADNTRDTGQRLDL